MDFARFAHMSWKKAAVFTVLLTFGPVGCNRNRDSQRRGPSPRHDETAQPPIRGNQQAVPSATPNGPNPDQPGPKG